MSRVRLRQRHRCVSRVMIPPVPLKRSPQRYGSMGDVPTTEQMPLLMPAPPVETDRLVLRPIRADDVDAVVEHRSRPAVHAYLSDGAIARSVLKAKFHHRIARMSMPSDDATEVQLVVERRDDGSSVAGDAENSDLTHGAGDGIIGDCGFRITRAWTKDDAPTEHLVARIHYALDDTAAGRGYGTEIVRALVTHLFAHPRVHRVQADVFADNVASRRVLEKLGFRCEGYFVDDGIIDGRFVDATVYSLLRREWDAGES